MQEQSNELHKLALNVEDLEIAYGKIRAVQSASFLVREGFTTALIGANGAGKSSILNAISGLVHIQNGKIMLPRLGQDLRRLPAHRRVRDLGIVMLGEGQNVFGNMTVAENLAFGAQIGSNRRLLSGKSTASAYDIVFSLFPILRERKDLSARSLSGGERQMLALGRSMLMEPVILLVDEPSTGLAPVVVAQIFDALKGMMRATTTMSLLLVEQNVKLALELADWVYVLEQGKITTNGTAEAIATDPKVLTAYLGE